MAPAPKGRGTRGAARGSGESWTYVDDPIQHVIDTAGLVNEDIHGSDRDDETIRRQDLKLSKERSGGISSRVPTGQSQWCSFPQQKLESPGRAR
jgi:Mn-containing catalase